MVRLEYIPAHRYIGIWDKDAGNYGEFWNGRDCDAISDLVESLRPISHDIVGPGMAGWMEKDGKSGYFYGTGVPADYNGEVPEGFTLWDVPESLYLVFFYPPFDYAADNAEVMSRVEKLAWSSIRPPNGGGSATNMHGTTGRRTSGIAGGVRL